MARIHYGNAAKDSHRWKGWFVGHFVEPSDDIRATCDVEIKWGVHEAGDGRTDATYSVRATTLCILVSGDFTITLDDTPYRLSKRGDYLIWGPGIGHNWTAHSPTTIITLRFPSAPDDSRTSGSGEANPSVSATQPQPVTRSVELEAYWREAMSQLRQTHGDVWNGVRFFLVLNGILLAAVFGLVKLGTPTIATGVLQLVLAVLGVSVTIVAEGILSRHRRYYLQTQARKTLVEKKLGFYDQRLDSSLNFSLPWSVPEEDVEKLKNDPEKWVEKQIRASDTISKRLFGIYYGVIVIYVVIILAICVGFYRGYFGTAV